MAKLKSVVMLLVSNFILRTSSGFANQTATRIPDISRITLKSNSKKFNLDTNIKRMSSKQILDSVELDKFLKESNESSNHSEKLNSYKNLNFEDSVEYGIRSGVRKSATSLYNNDESEYQSDSNLESDQSNYNDEVLPCNCGIFMSSQLPLQNNVDSAESKPILTYEQDRFYPCNQHGLKQCQIKCIQSIIHHLPNANDIICSVLDRDCYKERAYLFVQNCFPEWHNTRMSGGKEYCCKDGESYSCKTN